MLLQKILGKKQTFRQLWPEYLAIFFLIFVMILTLSRGAIFALLLGALVLFVVNFTQVKMILKSCLIFLLALIGGLSFQGFCATINPNFDDNFYSAVSRSLSQLSMNILNLPVPKSAQTATEEGDRDAGLGKTRPIYDGYVAGSTDTRVNLSKIALQTWSQHPQKVVFGVGLGGGGVAMADFLHNHDTKQIVQNEFIEMLLELGVIGGAIFASLLIGLLCVTRKRKWLWAVILAFMLQWNFFSGYPNALHIYLILAIIFVTNYQTKSFCTTTS